MKLIIVGSSGFVGKALVRQAVSSPAITSVVGLGRSKTPAPENLDSPADAAKFTSVVCDDFLNYSDDIKEKLSGADACIWVMGVTPNRSKIMTPDEVRRVCLDYTVTGIETLSKLPRGNEAKPLRFVYVGGYGTERDKTKKPWIMGDFLLMRGEVESRVLEFAKDSNGAVEACVVKPGLIRDSQQGFKIINAFQDVATSFISLPIVYLNQVVATLLNQATKGFEKETLENADVARIGQRELVEQEEALEN
ncbi:hypothetical protein HDV64DRAFT_275901 [Trichoderma sp. TUCIM 5745]